MERNAVVTGKNVQHMQGKVLKAISKDEENKKEESEEEENKMMNEIVSVCKIRLIFVLLFKDFCDFDQNSNN